MKLAVMKRYELTEDGYYCTFRASDCETKEPCPVHCSLDCMMCWILLSNTAESIDGLRDFIVKEQFINSCPKKLAIHLRERAPEALEQIAKIAFNTKRYTENTYSPVDRISHLHSLLIMTGRNRPLKPVHYTVTSARVKDIKLPTAKCVLLAGYSVRCGATLEVL